MVEKIKDLCSQNGISLNDLERQIDGVGINTIYRWDSSSPNAARLSAVADFFGVSVDWLLGREESHSKQETSLLALFRKMSADHQRDLLRIAESFAEIDRPIAKDGKIS